MLLAPDAKNAKTLNKQDIFSGIITKLMVVRANGAAQRMSGAHFFDTAFTRCSSSRVLAHILGRAVLGQIRPNVAAGVPIRKEDDNRYSQ